MADLSETAENKALAEADDATYPFDLAGFTLPVRAASALAQRWFDRGLMQAINFNHDEAVLCFTRCAAVDPSCAMAQWGIAYASGVNYNKATYLDDKEAQRGFNASRAAVRLAVDRCGLPRASNGRSRWPI